MAKGDVQQVRRRKPVENARVAKRCAEFCARHAPCVPEGVQPLNTGFFTLEAMRMQHVAKQRAKRRRKAKGK